jgi:hypothetical protein
MNLCPPWHFLIVTLLGAAPFPPSLVGKKLMYLINQSINQSLWIGFNILPWLAIIVAGIAV